MLFQKKKLQNNGTKTAVPIQCALQVKFCWQDDIVAINDFIRINKL